MLLRDCVLDFCSWVMSLGEDRPNPFLLATLVRSPYQVITQQQDF